MDVIVKQIRGGFSFLTPVIEANKNLIVSGFLLSVIILPIVCAKMTDTSYVNQDVGYRLKGPGGWHRNVSADKQTVKYTRHKKSTENSAIKAEYEVGNSYGTTALDFLVYGLVPKFAYTYEKMQGMSLDLREQPYLLERKGREWATVSFYINHRDLQVFYVTLIGDYVLILSLNSPEGSQDKDEKLLSKVVDSLRIF